MVIFLAGLIVLSEAEVCGAALASHSVLPKPYAIIRTIAMVIEKPGM